jgi:riboflavin biosynthesis pyrimidine reductase
MSEPERLALPGGALEVSFEAADLPAFELPPPLERAYGGRFGLAPSRLVANFVASVDGAVVLEGGGESGHVISGDSAADHFVMGLLRASADAVFVGAGTLRASPKHLWTPSRIYPPAAASFRELRRTLRSRDEEPKLVVVTASGDIDPAWPALAGGIVATTPAGEARLRSTGKLGNETRLVVSGADRVPLAPLVALLRSEGYSRLLTEGGPGLFGELVRDGLVNELFLTVSPRLFGRAPGGARKTLVHGVDLEGKALELLGVRRSGSHLFLRYALG